MKDTGRLDPAITSLYLFRINRVTDTIEVHRDFFLGSSRW